MNTIAIRGRTLAYRDVGTGPAVLFGHSYLWDSAMWNPQVEALSSSFRCIVPDLWAHGQSDPPPGGGISLDSMADDMLALVDGLDLDIFSVVGLSVGGMWGGRMAIRFPDRVRSVTIMNSHLGPEPGETRAKYFGMLDTVAQLGLIPPPMQEAVIPQFFAPGTSSSRPGLVQGFRDHLTAIPPDRIPFIVEIGKAIFGRDSSLDDLAALRVPAMYIAGEQDASRPAYESEDMAARTPGSQIHILPGAGHISNLERPEDVNRLLLEFLPR